MQPLQRRMNLREALKMEAEVVAAPKVQKSDAFHAENVIRLWRKVEAQGVMPVTEQMVMAHELDQALDAGALDAGLALGDGMGVGVGDGMGDVMGGGEDLMSGLMGDGGHGGLLDGFGGGGDMGDGMGF